MCRRRAPGWIQRWLSALRRPRRKTRRWATAHWRHRCRPARIASSGSCASTARPLAVSARSLSVQAKPAGSRPRRCVKRAWTLRSIRSCSSISWRSSSPISRRGCPGWMREAQECFTRRPEGQGRVHPLFCARVWGAADRHPRVFSRICDPSTMPGNG